MWNFIQQWSKTSMSLHKRMYDIMMRDKAGLSKEFSFAIWCKRLAAHKKSTAVAEHYYRALAEDILTNELTDGQKKSKSTSSAKAKASLGNSAARSTPSCEKIWVMPEPATSCSTIPFLHCWICLSQQRHPQQQCYRTCLKNL